MSAVEFCTVEASVKRNPDLGSGITGAATTHIASLMITPVYPVSATAFGGVVSTVDMASARKLRECYHVPASGTTLPDIREGDLLVVGVKEYPVYYTQEWNDSDVPALQIVLQDIKQ